MPEALRGYNEVTSLQLDMTFSQVLRLLSLLDCQGQGGTTLSLVAH